MMPPPKRTASDSFSSSQQLVVKRQKSDANLNNGSAIAVVGNNAQNGALVQSV
jgi:Prp8 binding protein